MSTRAQIRFATREAGQSFNQHPSAIHAQFYKHSDGYPEGLGLDIADSIMNNVGLNGIEIEPLTTKHGDLEFIYYIWQAPGKETFISIFEVNGFGYCETCGQDVKTEDQCVFVGLPTELINKYSQTKNES
jgi:hypothetical protein